jgi:hypothetical protein
MFEFFWKVSEAGYEWVKTETIPAAGEEVEAGEFLAARTLAGQPHPYRKYPPLAETGLFKIFANLPKTPVGILTFADRYGFLGTTPRITIAQHVPGQHLFHGVTGERLKVWQSEIASMRHAVDLWEAARKGDLEFLSGFIKWHGVGAGRDGISYLEPPGSRGRRESTPLASLDSDPALMSLFPPGDVVMPARHALHVVIN